MIRRISCLLAIFMFASALQAREEYTRDFDKNIPWKGQRLQIDHSLGDVVVRGTPGSGVTIHAVIRVSAASQDEARRFSAQIEIQVDNSAPAIFVRTKYPEQHAFSGWRNVSYSVSYQIAAPPEARLQIRNSFGNVEAIGMKAGSDITNSHGRLVARDGAGLHRLEDSFGPVQVSDNAGEVSVENSNGSVDVSNIRGPASVRDRFGNVTVTNASGGVKIINGNGSVRVAGAGGLSSITNSFGTVEASEIRGDLFVNNSNGKIDAREITGAAELNTTFGSVGFAGVGKGVTIRAGNSSITGSNAGGPVTLQTSFGRVNLSEIRGGVQVVANNGDVTLAGIGGEARVKTSFGLVDATEIKGSLIVENNNGGVKVRDVQGANVRTSFGPVLLERADGPVDVVNQNGAIDSSLTGQKSCRPVRLQTSFGAVRLRIPENSNYQLTARTSFGKINTSLPIKVSGAVGSDSLSGVIGQGGCQLQVTNSNGSIDILSAQ